MRLKQLSLTYGSSILAMAVIVVFWRFCLHYLLAPDGPLQYVPPEWVAGSRGFVIGFVGLALFFVVTGTLYRLLTGWIRRAGGIWGQWILAEENNL